MPDATQLSQQFATNPAARIAYLKAQYARINALNPSINAVTYLRPLRNVVAEITHKLAQNFWEQTPFCGVPILIKGLSQAYAGFPATEGSQLFANATYDITDNFVTSLINAGFIIIGQTNTPEFGFQNTTAPQLFGPSRNPHNLLYSPGGSSGGSAAAIAANLSVLAAASDGGGSIRIPASWCGLVGLKPSRGRTFVGPNSWRGWQGASISFAITKSVADCAKLLCAIQANQSAAPFLLPPITQTPSEILTTPKPCRMAFSTTSPVGTTVSATAKAAVLTTVKILEAHGFACEEITPKINGRELTENYYVVNEVETAAMFAQIEARRQTPITPTDVEPLTFALAATGTMVAASEYSQLLSRWDDFSAIMDDFCTKYPIYITPTCATTAPKISEPAASATTFARIKNIEQLSPAAKRQAISDFFEPSLARTPFTQLANLTGQPAISLTLGKGKFNLPLGVQLQAKKGNEALLLAVAHLLEPHFVK